jgi:myo-inositol-1(or 4)-monophosphatase
MWEAQLKVAISAARAGAGELMSRRLSRSVREKAPKDLVTDADLASQAAIYAILRQAFPHDAFVGEEDGHTEPRPDVRAGDPASPGCWIVDPLDGTVNFVHRLQNFAVSIGYYFAGKMVVGVVYDPVYEELFHGVDGGGAFVNGQPVRVSDCREISQSLVACSFRAGILQDSPEVARFARVLEQTQSLRRLGSCALNMCYVADGRLDAYWATNVSSWDSAAGTVVAREAGATITAYDGSPLDDWNPRFCLSATPELHQSLLQLM